MTGRLGAGHETRPATWQLPWFSVGAFLLLGVLYAILGPALPHLSARFALSATGASLLLSFNAAGALAGVLAAGLGSRRLGPRHRSLVATAVLAFGCTGLAWAPTYALALWAALLLGFGFGMLDLTVNVWLATAFGDRSAAALNRLSASFGVGAIVAPLAVGLWDGDFRPLLLGCGALAVVLAIALHTMPRDRRPPVAAPPPTGAAWRSRGILLGFILFFIAYVAVESGVSGWEVTHLQDALGMGTGLAAALSSLFWGCFAAGRLIAAPLASRMAPARLLIGCLALAAVSLALATTAAAPVGYALAGLFLAPVFTTGLVWLTRVLPGGAPPTIVFAGGFLGPVLFSPLLGALRDALGPGAIPAALLGMALLNLALAIVLAQAVRRRRLDRN